MRFGQAVEGGAQLRFDNAPAPCIWRSIANRTEVREGVGWSPSSSSAGFADKAETYWVYPESIGSLNIRSVVLKGRCRQVGTLLGDR
ncbi:hypothetical protein AWB74_08673 [Caballeronia arvi]|uniref:Uncharacterized protein n=1 Tax=Caballeronia arvi TaxID=1777135 RepID=A0A158L5K3_9BURK|nr:hypothetical protein AWB74_08673 [Caballeronia arvi]